MALDPKKKKLSKLKMPADRAGISLDHLDDEGSDVHGAASDEPEGQDDSSMSEEANESPEEKKSESDAAAHLSDDELLAEIKKRGLEKQMDEDEQSEDYSGSEMYKK